MLENEPCIYTKLFNLMRSMPPLHIQITYHELNMLFITYKIHFHFPMRKSLDIFSFTTCNRTVASNKQRQEQNNLATI